MPPIVTEVRRPIALLGLLIVLCLACDFLMAPILAVVSFPPKMLGVALFLAILGCILAQGCLLAAWLAWSDQPFWQRLTGHSIVSAILYLVWTTGVAVSQRSKFAEISAVVGLTVPLVSIAAQTPLWIARQTFGWRLIRAHPNNVTNPSPLSIRDLMLATVLVALALTLARLAPKLDNGDRGIVWAVMFVIASTTSAIALLPAGPLLLRTQLFQRGMLFASLYAVSWVGLLWLIVLVARHQGLSTPPRAILVGISSLILSFAATVILAAAVARAQGYRLVSGRPPRPSIRHHTP